MLVYRSIIRLEVQLHTQRADMMTLSPSRPTASRHVRRTDHRPLA
jgi:hypothetical protein